MGDGADIPLRVTSDPELAEEWELVLVAQGFSPHLERTRDGFVLKLPEREVEGARAGLAAYERENPPEPRAEEQPAAPNLAASASVAAILILFFLVTALFEPTALWLERGSADADRILRGELWRTVTALSLHANFAHAFSNAIAATLFIGALASILGLGLSTALAVMAGAAGNLANAFFHGAAHVSVGASTAVFGCVGLLGGLGLSRDRRQRGLQRRTWAPVAAALALLAMLGTEGERVDVMAHLFGFVFGAGMGLLVGLFGSYPARRPFQWVWGGGALAVFILCWVVALR